MTKRTPLPPDGDFELAGITLRGRGVGPDAEWAASLGADYNGGPALWVTDEPVDEAGSTWMTLPYQCHQTGLIPLILEPEWWGRYLEPQNVSLIGRESAESLLAQGWEGSAPFGRTFPGLAAPTGGPPLTPPAQTAARGIRDARLALVSANRPADTITAYGWTGSANPGQEAWELSTILRSWEERFGAVLMAVGDDTMKVLVSHPSPDREHALHVAAEHMAFCADNIEQGAGSIEAYAAEELFEVTENKRLQPAIVWHFWWD